jgi:hypothetical protein
MVIEPPRLAAATLAVSLVACGCGPLVDRCQAGTLVVAVSLDSAAVVADELLIDLSLDGGSAQQTSLSHDPGAAVGNVVVQFPRGYPTGSFASVLVTARAGGTVVGSGRAGATLSGSCQSTTLTVDGTGDDAGSDDLASAADLSSPPDLRPPPADLRPPPPDLYCPGGGVELCFNGIDDDCDGLADCADPDCAPVATCVTATAPPFTYGTQEPATGTCPTPTTAATMYQANANGGGCASSCSCGASGCTVPLYPSMPCGTPPTQPMLFALTHSCQDLEFTNNFLIGAPAGTLSCSSSGSATPVTPPVLTTALECAMPGTVAQGGCNAGQVCVARGTQQCVRAPGNGVACPSGYPNGVTWFSSYTDGRSCSCACTNNGCGAAQVAFYGNASCGSGSGVTIKSGYICSPPDGGAKLIGFCPLSVTLNGALQFNNTNATTVCCP